MTPLDSVLTAAFGALAHARGARALHPDGAAFHAVLRVPGGRCPGVPLLDVAGEHRAVVRVSRAAGMPRPWPDGIGLALRVPDAHGPGRHQDVLLTTTIGLPLLHHLVVPTTAGVFGQSYTSAFTYRLGRSGPQVLGARPLRKRRGADLPEVRRAAAAGDARFALCAAPPLGTWRPLAEIVLGGAIPDDEAEALTFDPVNTGGGLAITPFFLRARHAAYRASQARRPLPHSAP